MRPFAVFRPWNVWPIKDGNKMKAVIEAEMTSPIKLFAMARWKEAENKNKRRRHGIDRMCPHRPADSFAISQGLVDG